MGMLCNKDADVNTLNAPGVFLSENGSYYTTYINSLKKKNESFTSVLFVKKCCESCLLKEHLSLNRLGG